MNLHLLRIFASLAKAGTFSEAARSLYISQPAVSKGIQQLERELGVQLLDRTSRRVALTEAGQLLYEYAGRIFATEKAAESGLAELQGLERGQLLIGASQTIGTYLLPPALGTFHQRYPKLRLHLEITNTQQVIESLRQTPLGLAYVEGPISGDDLDVTVWRQDQLVVIAPPDHPLVRRRSVTFEMLAAEPYLQREMGSGTGEIAASVFGERHSAPNIALILGSNQAIKQAVIAGLGISIVSEATIALEKAAGTLAIINVRDLKLSRPLYCVSILGRPLSRAATAFHELLTDKKQMGRGFAG